MEQRDFFLKQLDQFGRALANVLARFTNRDSSFSAASKIEVVDKVLLEHLHVSLNDLLDIDSTVFIDGLLNKYKVNNQNFEKLAFILEECAENCENSVEALRKAIVLHKYIQEHSTNYSFDRQEKIEQLKELINHRSYH